MLIGAEMWEYSPQNCQNFEFWAKIFLSGATRLHYFHEIRNSQRLYASIGSNVKFGTGSEPKVRSPVSNFTFTAPKTVVISNFGHKFAPRGSLVCTIFTKFSDFIHIYR